MASIEEAKNIVKDTPISSIINFYHPLNKRGTNYEGLCPFHGDSHPSLKVNDSKGIYKCFACDAAGDAIKFVQEKENLSFIEALKDICSKLGVTLDQKKTKQKNPKLDIGLRVNKSAYKLYKKYARENKPIQYDEFLKKRNLSVEVADKFGLGFAPGNNALTHYLNSLPEQTKEMALKVATEIGIIRDGKWGQYDFFRDRVIFPIWDQFDQIRGFSTRAVKEDQIPKYLNSGESFVFDKRNILYGLNFAKSHIREHNNVIVVEGNMDVISMHQFGFQTCVAVMGIALSHNAIKQLKNMTSHFYLALDSDNAGMKAMKRINHDLLSQGIIAKYINFEPCKDPDDFLNKFGRLELQERIQQAPNFTEIEIESLLPNPIPSATDMKLSILNDIFKVLMPIESHLYAKEMIIKYAKELGLKSEKNDLIEAFHTYCRTNHHQNTPASFPQSTSASQREEASVEHDEIIENEVTDIEPESSSFVTAPKITLSNIQKKVLSTLITHPEALESDNAIEVVDLMGQNEVKQFIQWLKQIYLEIDDSEYISIVKYKSDDVFGHNSELIKIIHSGLFLFDSTNKLDQKVIKKMIRDLVAKLREDQYMIKINHLKQQQKEALTEQESIEILNQIQQLNSEMFQFRTNKQ